MGNRRASVWCVLAAVLVWQAPAAKTAGTALNVVIIGVTEFDDPNWFNGSLATSIDASVIELSEFARNTLKANVITLTSKKETESGNLLRVARDQLRTMSNNAVTLVFVLSHGTVITGSPGTEDLLIAASDTPYSERAEEIPQHKALLLKHDLLDSVWPVRKGAVFFFIDACYSGAAEGWETVTKAFQAQRSGGVHLMCIASATARTKAFKADFTKAIVQAWKTTSAGDCHQPYQIPDFLHGLMLKTDSDLGPNDAHPTVVVPYFGDVCLESFNANQSIVFFYNVSKNDLTLSIERADAPSFSRQPNLRSEVSTAVPLQRVRYTLKLFEDNSLKGAPEDLDLTATAARVVIVGGSESVAAVARAYEAAAGSAAAEALPQATGDALRVSAYAAYVASGDAAAATRVMSARPDLLSDLQDSPASVVANKKVAPSFVLTSAMDAGAKRTTVGEPPEWREWFGSDSAPAAAQGSSTEKLAEGAKDLQTLGDFSKAGAVWLSATKTAGATDVKRLALQAYLSFAAAKQVKAAAAVRRQFRLDLSTVCPTCLGAEMAATSQPKAADHFGAIALQRVLKPES